jgi:hypothetical protein
MDMIRHDDPGVKTVELTTRFAIDERVGHKRGDPRVLQPAWAGHGPVHLFLSLAKGEGLRVVRQRAGQTPGQEENLRALESSAEAVFERRTCSPVGRAGHNTR